MYNIFAGVPLSQINFVLVNAYITTSLTCLKKPLQPLGFTVWLRAFDRLRLRRELQLVLFDFSDKVHP